MNSKSYVTLQTVVISIMLICLSGCQGKEAATEKDILKIGMIASLTGPAGEEGNNWVEGARLAAEKLLAGGTPLKLIVEDDATTTSKVASAFNKLAGVDRVQGVVGGTWDFLAEVAYPLAARFRVPFITPTNPFEILPEAQKDNPYIFTNGLSIAAEKAAALELVRNLGVKTICLLEPNIPWGFFHARMIEEIAEQLKIAINHVEFTYEGYPGNLAQTILKCVQKNPEMIYAPLDYNGVDIMTRELARLKADPYLLLTQHLDKAFSFSNDPSRYTRAFGVYPKAAQHSFVEDFIAKYGHAPKVYAAEGYDALMFLVSALKAGVKLEDPAAHFEYEGVTGKLSLPAIKHSIANTPAVIMTTRHGVFEEDS